MKPTWEQAKALADFIRSQSVVPNSPFAGVEVYSIDKANVGYKKYYDGLGMQYFNLKVTAPW